MMAYNNVKLFLENGQPASYNFEFECNATEYISERSALLRYFIYRATAPERRRSGYEWGAEFAKKIQESKKYDQLGDCDGSAAGGNIALIHDVYSKLWGWQKATDTFGSIAECALSCQFGGETMNSMQTVLNAIVAILAAPDAHKNWYDKRIPTKNGTEKGAVSINYMLALCADDDCKEPLLAALESVKGLSEYANAYHTIGNFVLVPSGFNKGRASKTQDYWDLSLQYLKEHGWGNHFNPNGSNKADYYWYINYFFLWGYVEKGGDTIILLKKDINSMEGNEQFLKEVVLRIKQRGCFIEAMLKLQQQLGEDGYAALRKSVFSKNTPVYNTYKDVFVTIKEYLKNQKLSTDKSEKLLLEYNSRVNGESSDEA